MLYDLTVHGTTLICMKFSDPSTGSQQIMRQMQCDVHTYSLLCHASRVVRFQVAVTRNFDAARKLRRVHMVVHLHVVRWGLLNDGSTGVNLKSRWVPPKAGYTQELRHGSACTGGTCS